MTTQAVIVFVLAAALVGFIAGALMGDAFKWHYNRKERP